MYTELLQKVGSSLISSNGLAGTVFGRSAISSVGPASTGLIYRGYPVTTLSKHCSFEEVAHLLIHGKLPNIAELKHFQNILKKHRKLSPQVANLLETIPASAHPMDVLSIGCSYIGATEPIPSEEKDIYPMLMSSFASILGYWFRFHFHNGQRIQTETQVETIAEHVLTLFHQKQVSQQIIEPVNVSLILYADHGTAASTFAARVTASTRSDSFCAISSAIGTLKGPLHGGANEAAMELISSYLTPDEAEKGIREKFRVKEKIMGFGHRVYKNGDPRHNIAKAYAEALCEASEEGKTLYSVAERIENLVTNEKGIHPNVDFYMALLYNRCGIATPLFTPLFVVSRTAGWGAHIQEERMVNKLIRPSSEYVGPSSVEFVPLKDRK